jgi:hypothetical protein
VSASGRVLHLVPPNGGGVDRFVRDLCSRRPSDWVLHVSEAQCVVECPAEDLFIPVASADFGDLVDKGVLGRPLALHAHSTVGPVREATRSLARRFDMPWILTLHDVQSAGQDPSMALGELEQRLDFTRNARHRTVPSRFMRDVAGRFLGESFSCTVVENGVDPLPAAHAGSVRREQFPIAVIGAMGQHKGLAHLKQVAQELPEGVRIALLGYADGQLDAGWLVPERIWVHGVFEPGQLPQLVADYGCALAFFPKGQPESYCYALSDAWLAGLPAVGPDHGAIGERLGAHGGGVAYGVDEAPSAVARIIAGQLEQPGSSGARVSAAAQGLASVAAMVKTMNQLYAGVAAAEAAPNLDALKQAAASHLDSRFFRQELLRLQGDFAAAALQRDSALEELRTLAGNFDQRGAWIDQLQQSNDSLQKDCENLLESRDSLQKDCENLVESRAGLLKELEILLVDREAVRADRANLQANYDLLLESRDGLQARSDELQLRSEELQLRSDSLQASVDGLQQQAAQMQASIAQLQHTGADLQDRLDRLTREYGQLHEMHLQLVAVHDTLVRRLTWPVRLLPVSWQRWIKKTARRVLVGGEKND